ncbi:hypothetical protein LEMLEM_LOCUS1572, partial [Lemmus lemmus]
MFTFTGIVQLYPFFIIYYLYNILSVCMPAGQKRAPDLITDGCESPCGCWELNSGPLEEQAMLLTAEPSPQSLPLCFVCFSLSALYFSNVSFSSSSFFFFLNIFIYWLYTACFPAHQKRASDLITDGCEPPCGCWELNS